MAVVTIIPSDSLVVIDGDALTFDFSGDIASDVWAVQWNGTSGHIEYNDGTPNADISSISTYADVITGHATETTRLATVATAAAASLAAAEDYDSAQPSTSFVSETEPTYTVKVGDTWFDPVDEILSIAVTVDDNIVWIGV